MYAHSIMGSEEQIAL